jgi:predicted nucleic acid-binding protein
MKTFAEEPRVVISDATPLRYLIQIAEIGILRELYSQIIVPAAVASELSALKTPLLVRNWIARPPDWVVVETPRSPESLPFELLGLGEREAIAIALQSGNSILLTDDLDARFAAESLQVRVVPTIRILSTAAGLGLLDFEDALRRLRETNFRISSKVLDQIRDRLK